jgi:hypothetical protein
MEEGALAVARFFTRLIMPVGMGAGALGLLTIVKGFRSSGREGSSVLERVGVGLCGTLAAVLIVLLGVNTVRRGLGGSYWPAALLVMLLLLAAPAMLWKTRYRMAGEGMATVAIAGISIVTGFSIGFLFVPLVVLMMWLCIRQLRRPNHARKVIDLRVDSLP